MGSVAGVARSPIPILEKGSPPTTAKTTAIILASFFARRSPLFALPLILLHPTQYTTGNQLHEEKQKEQHDNFRAAMMNAPVMVLSKSLHFPSPPPKNRTKNSPPPFLASSHPPLPPSPLTTRSSRVPVSTQASFAKDCSAANAAATHPPPPLTPPLPSPFTQTPTPSAKQAAPPSWATLRLPRPWLTSSGRRSGRALC